MFDKGFFGGLFDFDGDGKPIIHMSNTEGMPHFDGEKLCVYI
jgi:hypothetical protein